MKLHKDFTDFLYALNNNQVEYMLVGAFTLGFLGQPRYTGDLDIWIRPTELNAPALISALAEFGLSSLKISLEDILSGHVIQLGYPPVRIDLLTQLEGLTTQEIWESRQSGKLSDIDVFYLGKQAFIKNKKALGRHKDLADLEAIDELD